MRKSTFFVFSCVLWLMCGNFSRAQETNALIIYTDLELFESQVDTVIVKGSAPVGTVPAKTGTVSVWCKESENATSGQKMHGVAIGVRVEGAEEDVTILDYDELDSFLAGIEFISRVDVQVTSLSSFQAGFTSKGGLKLSAYTSNKHVGSVHTALQSNRILKSRVLLEPDQLARFKIVVQEAKAKLDALRQKKP